MMERLKKLNAWFWDDFAENVLFIFFTALSMLIFGSNTGFKLMADIGGWVLIFMLFAPFAIFILSAFFRVRR